MIMMTATAIMSSAISDIIIIVTSDYTDITDTSQYSNFNSGHFDAQGRVLLRNLMSEVDISVPLRMNIEIEIHGNMRLAAKNALGEKKIIDKPPTSRAMRYLE